ncbi:MAG: ATP-binding cassette domain-containing protein [Syntrophotalea acetylenica]|jgi:phospholipid/cholesterol/gamma-HCH transport system ATP-binding protein|uniref:ABC transporter ATP-binding protein n=1 Tax=Syntrophotalea acetylenica TaxID=29542 RepID=A0A1L3GEW1_SYNAC|nr:ATP-binding cassette domain-containing protein [Syntrophotalea acetylenica]APG24473.1 ABC transporter ATP-binding protein [Syntrophotalea acetylenica]APG45058.1 ABC transporter ATP-binding protein [Syntrophotalea acetylenica]MDD4458108.1 ATP-binding cassette domain-containing protein [Syntrophotalea acetylenica]MDY0262346.1 ATP-binding cassette domain-containing protein [Syntrophotalea acetylenica]
MTQEKTRIAIELIDVERAFGRQQVLRKVNLTVREGTTTVIVGPSGQGKSVILKHMLGLLRPDRGKVLVYGQNLADMSKRQMKVVRKDFGVLFQNVALFDSMTVYDNVALPLRERTDLSEDAIRDNVEEKLALMDLADMGPKFPAQLSGGMKKRVGLARALVMQPRIVFFDEPTTGLDVSKSNEIYRLFHKTQAKLKYTAVIVSHDVPKIFKLADYVALIHEGQILGNMSPEQFQLSDHPVIKAFVEETMGPIYSSEREERFFYEEV